MTKEEMKAGLAAGRTLCQEEWASPDEIRAVDELLEEGFAQSTPWRWRDEFQCEMRRIYLHD